MYQLRKIRVHESKGRLIFSPVIQNLDCLRRRFGVAYCDLALVRISWSSSLEKCLAFYSKHGVLS
jgi:hypothetical protein